MKVCIVCQLESKNGWGNVLEAPLAKAWSRAEASRRGIWSCTAALLQSLPIPHN